MNVSTLLVTTLVVCAIYTEAYSTNGRSNNRLKKRQAQSSNADQMVQNILQWLQTVYAQNPRRIRQGTLREYLPPANTERPRPFQSGYAPAGFSPEPPFPFPTNPVTGGLATPEIGPQSEGQTEEGSGGGEPQPGPSEGVSTPYPIPSEPEQPSERPSFPEEQPAISTTTESGLPTRQPTVPSEPLQPFPSYSTGLPEGGSFVTTTIQPQQPGQYTEPAPGGPITGPSGAPEYTTSGPTEGSQPGLPSFISPPGTQPPVSQGEAKEYPTAGQTQPPIGFSTSQPGSTLLPIEGTSESTVGSGSNVTPEQPSETPQEPEVVTPEGPGPVITREPEPSATLVPSGFTTSTPTPSEIPAETSPEEAGSESAGTTLSPEANTIPGPEKSAVDEEDLKHPPHIHAIDVQCSKEMMTINIEFNREFNGIIYSKGFYSNPDCRYVQENSGQTKYTFTVNLEMCGTEFVNAFDTQNQSYLENVLVLQNEVGIQEVWDTVRSVRCLWEGNIKDTLSVAFSIGMLSQEIVTFSGDTAMAKLDVVLGRGPFGEPANGLVKIGEEMTLVVSVSGDPGFDLQVKDCKAVDSEGRNSVALTDDDGCILKPKVFGAFQKTRETGNTGASIIAYAYFNAFKFPDQMDLMVECNIELCKTDCDMCSRENQQLEPAKRRRRDVSYNSTLGDGLTMGKLLRVFLPEDLNEKTALEVSTINNICMSVQTFVFSTATLVSFLVLSTFTSICLWLKRGERKYLKN